MEQFRCYGCMQLISEPVCPHCGHPKEGVNRPEQLSVGTVLNGRYLVGRAVDRNEEGLVYVGLDQSRNKTVNIREYFPSDCARREGSAVIPLEQVRFDAGLELRRQEASLLVNSKELATVSCAVDAFEENGTVYLVLDQVKGPSLGLYASRRGGVLDPQEALRILRGVIGAVAVLHQNNFAHGGISQENIILDPMGGARLLGFGENRSADPADDVLALCGLICGGADPAQLPGLTEQQQMALGMGLCPDPKDRFSSAVALRRALFGEVTLPIGPLAPLPKVEPAAEMPKTEAIVPEMPKTEAIVPEMPKPEDTVPEMPKAEPAAEMPKTEAIVSGMPKTEAIRPEQSGNDAQPEEDPIVPPQPVAAAPVTPPVSRVPATEIVSEFKIQRPVPQPEPVPEQPEPIPEPPVREMPRTEAAPPVVPPVQSWEPQQFQWDAPPQQPQWDAPPQQPEKSKKTGLIVGIIVGAVVLIAALVICFFTVHIWEDATCEAPKTCALCGKTQGKSIAHDWQDATCEEPEICSYCGKTQKDALGHSWKDASCTAPKTCAICGMTEGTVLPHDWMDATCEAPKTCAACGATEGSAGGHTWKDATCTAPKVCTTCGETSGSALGHDWKDATYTDPKTCTRCGKTEGDPKGYLDYVSGDFQRFTWGNSTTSCYVFDSPIYNCRSFDLYFEPTFNYNAWVDDWKLLYQDTSGVWHEYCNFTLNTSTYEHVFDFSPTLNIKAVAVVPRINGTYSYSFSLGVWDVYYTN